MNDFVAVVGIAAFAAGLTYIGAPAAERFDVPHRLVSGALQFAAGIITALVAVTLMPPAMRNGPYGRRALRAAAAIHEDGAGPPPGKPG